MSIAFPKPDEGVLAHRNEVLAGLAQLVAPEALVISEDERRAFETDALTAYRKMPLAVVLPSTTQEVSAVLKFCASTASRSFRAGPARRSPAAPSRRRTPSSSASPR